MFRRVVLAATLLLLAACSAPEYVLPGASTQAPKIEGNFFTASDGAKTLFRAWKTDKPLKAVVLSLHGFNDYGTSIAKPALYLNAQGITVYAYDQRGFGAGPHPGQWPGIEGLTRDFWEVAELVHKRHPNTPLYLLGESMGGAVVMTAVARTLAGKAHWRKPVHSGVILSAPAVWGRSTMPFYQRWLLWLAAHTVPDLKLSGRGLNITPSDNEEMLKALGRDPMIIKETRVDTINGLTDLMGAALDASEGLSGPLLILYGANDEIIRKGPTRAMLARLPAANKKNTKVAVYDKGYHMLLRDLQAETVLKDIVAWIDDQAKALPSGADKRTLVED